MTDSESMKRIEIGAELPTMERPRTLTEFEDLVTNHPDRIREFYSDDDLRALIPNQDLAEQIIKIADGQNRGSDAA